MPKRSRTCSAHHEDRFCHHCGLPFAWRKKWAAVWERVRFCSERCRRSHSPAREATIEREIVGRLARGRGTICPSEVSRALWPDRWRDQMERVRCAARRLEARGVIEWSQRGRRIEPRSVRGPVRFGPGARFPRAQET